MRTGGAGNGKLGAVRGGRGKWTWDGGGGRVGARGRGSGGGAGLGWSMRMGGAGNGKRGAFLGGKGTPTWDGAGMRGIARGSESGGCGALGGRGGTSGSGSGAKERLRRGGPVGGRGSRRRVRCGGGGSGSAAVCGTGPRCGASRASQQASAGLVGPRVLPPITREGGGSPPHFVDLPRRGAAAVAAGSTGRVAVPGGGGPGGSFGLDVVAVLISFLVWGGRPLVVGGVVGWSARWVVLPPHVLVLLVQGRLRPAGVGWCGVVVVVVVVVVVGGWALVAVALVVLVMVLRVCA